MRDGQSAELFAAIQVHDSIDLSAVPPSRIDLPDGPLREGGFSLSRQVWAEGPPARTLAGVTRRAILTSQLGQSDRQLLKDVRSRFKQLRFAFVMFDQHHRIPRRLDRITRAMGNFQDALGHDRRLRVRMLACHLRLLLSRRAFARLIAETSRYAPTDDVRFAALIERQMVQLRRCLTATDLTICEFHDARKIVSRLVAMYDTMTVLAPSPETRQALCHLSTINGLMGALHDKLVARKMVRRRDYTRGRICLPDEIAVRLAALERSVSSGLAAFMRRLAQGDVSPDD